MSDEEVVDQKATLEVSCKPKCVRQLKEYQFSATVFDEESVASRFLSKTLIVNFDAIKHFACTKRIEGDETGNKHCTGQYFDYWYCIDKCVAAKLFDHLK